MGRQQVDDLRRVGFDAVTIIQAIGEIDRLPVDQDRAHLRVRDAQRLDGMFDRGVVGHALLDERVAPVAGQEVVEIAVEAESDGEHGHSSRSMTGSS